MLLFVCNGQHCLIHMRKKNLRVILVKKKYHKTPAYPTKLTVFPSTT
jgi:hypothetical protein